MVQEGSLARRTGKKSSFWIGICGWVGVLYGIITAAVFLIRLLYSAYAWTHYIVNPNKVFADIAIISSNSFYFFILAAVLILFSLVLKLLNARVVKS